MISLRPETLEDAAAIEHILDRAFGPGRFAKVSDRVREFAHLRRDLSVVAVREHAVIAVCRMYDVAVGDQRMVYLGPLATDPDAQASGVGVAVTQAALDAARADGAGVVVVVGQPRFFLRFGFCQIPDGRITLPGPVEARRLQWLNLADKDRQPALSGALSPLRAAS